jgi:hypothetical protein
MVNVLKSNLNAAKPTPGQSGVPTGVDEYAEWFNQTFTFAKARVKIDERGRKFIDLEYNR